MAILLSTNFLLCTAAAQTELGSEDDLTVMGADGTAVDPDVEIKGFSVFGSTQAAYTGAVIGPGSVVVNGVLAVSSGAYFVGNSTFTGAGKIFINDGSAGQILSKNADGALQWASAGAIGDDLGNHVATITLAANYGIITTTITASTGAFGGYVNAARYLVNNSTVIAILPGYKSFAIGMNAGILNGANADYNLFVGEQAGESNVTGDDNAFFGYKAGYLNTASDNTFVGYEVGYYNSSGFSNVFVGHQAGFSNETGSDNTFVGKYAGGNGYDGSHSSLFGSNAGYANSGDNNSFVGSSAGHDNTTGANNSLLGYQAGSENRTGSANSIFGAQAGYGVSANSCSSSTLMGYKAGFAVTTGSDNLLLGFQTGDSLTTGSRNIIIGYDEDAPLATTNDYINIGGLLHGDMAQSTMTVYGDLYANHFYGDGSGLSGISASPVGSALTGAYIWVGDTSNQAAAAAVSGDVTINNTGVTAIGSSKVTNAMLAGAIADSKLGTISTAGKVSNSATTATSANTANAIVARDANGDTIVRYLNSTYVNMSHAAAARNTDTVFYSSTDNYVRKNTAAGMRASLDVGPLTSCPSGMVLMGTGRSTYCIETADRAVATYYNASMTCLNAGRYLCTYQEFGVACTNQGWSTVPWRWAADAYTSGTPGTWAVIMGSGSCFNSTYGSSVSSTVASRCCQR